MLIDSAGQALLAAGEHAKAIRHFSALAAGDPDNPAPSLGLTLALAGASRFGEALVAIEHARGLAPANIDLLAAQANLYEQMGDESKALQGYLELLAKDPNHLPAAHNLGSLLYRLGHFAEAAAQHRDTVRRHPQSFATWRDLGQALVAAGQLDAGIDALAKACQLAPHDRDSRFAYGLALLRAERWAEGWPLYEARWRPNEPPPGIPTAPQWQGESLQGKQLVVIAEQGYGDTIMFSRYLPKLLSETRYLTLAVPSTLVQLMTASFSGIRVVDRNESKTLAADYTIPLGSLPYRLLSRGIVSPPSQTPYLRPSNEALRKSAEIIATIGKTATGLVWRGNPSHPADRQRSTTITDALERFSCAPPILSLQINPTESEKEFMRQTGIIDLAEKLSSFDLSAALLTKIRRLVTVDTAIANLAGAMHCPFLLLNRREGEWRWGSNHTGKSWYASCDKSVLLNK